MLLTRILFGLSLLTWALAFTPCNIYTPLRLKLRQSLSLNVSPEDESEDERAARMDLVRQLQKSFYQNEDMILPPERGSTIIKDLPLWRVQWTELPGFQNVLNVHVAHYTNMFSKIIFSDSKPKYFGHIYLPGGSDNMDNPEYKLEEGTKSTLVGVLMQISGYKQMDDGRLVLIVQAVEKFKIVEAQRHHSPYAIATVEIIPDEEFIESFYDGAAHGGDDHGKAVEAAFQLHPYEVRPVSMADCMMEGETQGISVSPLSNFDGEYKIPGKLIQGKTDADDAVFETERKVWIKLDEMINLLQQLVDPDKKTLPIPTQILGLLPLEPPKPWPEEFALKNYAKKLEIENILVGTFSKSPFVRVDTMDGYSPYRRAQRLSYMIPVLTDTVIALGNEDGSTRQDLLEIESTEERLEAALHKLELICNYIFELLQNK